ncbi:MAG: N-acetylmuramoyl-L-alanine amidase [Clostridia bacterium]|nr:N-acetylmuramoyl-L-alanine amidase [Clostridia bacterium]
MKKNAKLNSLIINKRMLAAAAFAAAAIFVAAVCFLPVSAASSPAGVFTVVIDAGHGGIDGGVTGVNSGVAESELNLAVAKALKKNFSAAGFTVVMTRTTSAGLYGKAFASLKKTDMENRRKIIENASPDLVISVHMNKCPLPSRRGAQVFFKAGDDISRRFAEDIQGQLNSMKDAARECAALAGDYYILNVSPCPAALIECGFLSNAEDEKLLLDESYREDLAYAVFKGAVAYLTARVKS